MKNRQTKLRAGAIKYKRLNKFSECFEELYYFFIMSTVEKRRAIFVAFCLNNLYGCYA